MMNKQPVLSIFLTLLLAFFLVQCGSKQQSYSMISVENIDTSINPADDFHAYVNGKWIKANPIPADHVGWGTFYVLYTETQERLRALFEEVAQKAAGEKLGSTNQKLGDLYTSGMDTATIEQKGYTPIQAYLERIDAIHDKGQLIDYMVGTEKEGLGFMLGYYVSADDKNSSMNILHLVQSSLSLPDRSYYFDKSEKGQAILKAFRSYITTLFTLSGKNKDKAVKLANQVLALETKIAKSHRKKEDLRIPNLNYNKYSFKELGKKIPSLDWGRIFSNFGMGKIDSLNVAQPNYYKELGALLKKEPIDVWKTKIAFELLNSSAAYLSKDFRDARFQFYNRILLGQKEQEPRWKTIVSFVNENIGELMGQVYVDKYFSQRAKQKMDELVDRLFVAYKKRIKNLDWMSDTTKKKALKKLHTIVQKIGYPNKWKTYDDMTISKDDYFGNLLQIRKHNYNKSKKELGQPVDKQEWFMNVSDINAYYNPSYNEIVFPAGILQAPFFDENADDASNYGSIGAIIGHEITHGFDDEGKEFDAEGNLKNWWLAEDEKKFAEKAKFIEDQYSGYKIKSGTPVNGKLTLGENIADIGGLSIAYDAFQMTKQAKENKLIDGYTPNQRFFISYAQSWRAHYRPETMELVVKTDPHSPPAFRVQGPLSVSDNFYKAFNVKEGDKMYVPPEEKTKIW